MLRKFKKCPLLLALRKELKDSLLRLRDERVLALHLVSLLERYETNDSSVRREVHLSEGKPTINPSRTAPWGKFKVLRRPDGKIHSLNPTLPKKSSPNLTEGNLKGWFAGKPGEPEETLPRGRDETYLQGSQPYRREATPIGESTRNVTL